jgi:hypothetical protein
MRVSASMATMPRSDPSSLNAPTRPRLPAFAAEAWWIASELQSLPQSVSRCRCMHARSGTVCNTPEQVQVHACKKWNRLQHAWIY